MTTIAAYLRRLDEELRLKRAPRRRLLAEAEDHLRCAAEELVGEGRGAVDAEHEAVARFGAAADVARRFTHAAASSTAKAAVAWSGVAFLAYGVVAVLFLVSAPGWLRDFPHGASSMLALQVATVALAVTALRALHWRRTSEIDDQRLGFVANGTVTAALAVGAGAVGELSVALTRPAPAPWTDAAPLIAAFGLAALLWLPATLVAAAGYARVSGLGALPGRPAASSGATLAEDIAALAPALGGIVRTGLRRPGWMAIAVAATAFAASFLAGDPALGAFEATAIVVGFLTLGRPLGLR